VNTIHQILSAKGNTVWSVNPQATVLDAIRLMAEKQIGALLVMEDDKLVGMVSERDYARQVILKGKASNTTPVSDIMTKRVTYVPGEQTVERSLALMTEKRIRHLPVMEDGKIVGVVSIGDLVKTIIDELQLTIEELERYIAG